MAKLQASEMVERVVSEALQIHGANGYQRGHPLEYLYRLARGRRLAAGTDEIQKNQIAASLKQEGLRDLA
jgi:alkylation response protein AidB-like acyl-CoA dehydrogenase